MEIDNGGSHKVRLLEEWGTGNGAGFNVARSPYAFNIPHALALAEDQATICVADRENGRIPCFETEGGKPKITIQPEGLGSTVYSIDYASANGEEATGRG